MPLYESICRNPECSERNHPAEHYYPHFDSPLAACDACGQPTALLISRPQIIWDKPLCAYADPSKEGYWAQQKMGGLVAYRRNSSRMADGKPERCILRTRKDQQEYCRAEGLAMPDEVGNLEISQDGQSVNGASLPGCWV